MTWLSFLSPLVPLLVKIVYEYVKYKGISNENEKKFLEAVQSIDALKSVKLKDDLTTIEDEFDRRDNV